MHGGRTRAETPDQVVFPIPEVPLAGLSIGKQAAFSLPGGEKAAVRIGQGE